MEPSFLWTWSFISIHKEVLETQRTKQNVRSNEPKVDKTKVNLSSYRLFATDIYMSLPDGEKRTTFTAEEWWERLFWYEAIGILLSASAELMSQSC